MANPKKTKPNKIIIIAKELPNCGKSQQAAFFDANKNRLPEGVVNQEPVFRKGKNDTVCSTKIDAHAYYTILVQK